MIEKFDGRYRIDSARLSKWNYGWNASYFVTICTEEKTPHFGSVHNQQFIANSMGEIALQCWLEMPIHYPFVELNSFIVMPNHVHGIVRINNGLDKNRGNVKHRHIHQRRFCQIKQMELWMECILLCYYLHRREDTSFWICS